MNSNSRIYYDKDELRSQTMYSERPLQYITDAKISERQIHFVHPEEIDESSKLRPKLTNLNYADRAQAELYGTAPFRASGIDTHKVDLESSLLQGDKNIMCDKVRSEIMFDTFEEIDAPLHVDSDLRPKSTRADMRNQINCPSIMKR